MYIHTHVYIYIYTYGSLSKEILQNPQHRPLEPSRNLSASNHSGKRPGVSYAGAIFHETVVTLTTPPVMKVI